VSRRIGAAIGVFFGLALAASVHGQDSGRTDRSALSSGLPVPRFVSLAADEVNMRSGPGVRYPVEWVYQRENLPVEVTAEFDQWRRVRDIDGTVGWVHQSLLSSRRSVIVTDAVVPVLEEASESAAPVARVEPGVQGQLLECAGEWCRVRFGDYRGWLPRRHLWGVYPDEEFG